MPDDPHRTQMIDDPNRTIVTNAPSLNATQTIKPVQCPVCKSHNPPGLVFCNECGLIFGEALPDDAFGAPAVQLPVLVDDTGREHALRPGENVVGRAGDISIADERVSRRHLAVTLNDDEATAEDLGSTNGTTLNGEDLQGVQALNDGDVLSLGGFDLRLSLPGEKSRTEMGLRGKTSALDTQPTVADAPFFLVVEGTEHPLREGEQTLGRREGNDIVIPNAYISGRHAKLAVRQDGVYITDLGSTNGTFIGSARLIEGQETRLDTSDALKFGELEARLKEKE